VKKNLSLALACCLAGYAGPAAAHMMQVAYNLPVPLWMYAYGATAALIASFAVVGYVVRARPEGRPEQRFDIADGAIARVIASPTLLHALRVLSVAFLVFAIASGLVGTSSAEANFNVTAFWIVFVLGITYSSALLGDFYCLLNPWLVLTDWLDSIRRGIFRGCIAYPPTFGYYPALALYMGFIWIELFAHTTPRSLSIELLVYTAVSLGFAYAFGKDAWVRYIEFFAVFFRLVAKIAPIEIIPPRNPSEGLRYRLRPPFTGLRTERAEHLSLLIFILFMLSSTAFDGLHDTLPWVTIFWKHIYPVLESTLGAGMAHPYVVLVRTFFYWQWLMLFLAPFVYLTIYCVFIFLAKIVTRSRAPMAVLTLLFAYSLVPIAFVYHLTHYFTLLLAQGPRFFALLSDPLGRGWNLWGTVGLFPEGILLDANVIWHTQVWLILIGHIVSVYLSHVEAIKVFGSRRQATLSQAPLLILMVALTTIGLWILSLPIAAGQVLLPTIAPG
jgi:hypothetical protein